MSKSVAKKKGTEVVAVDFEKDAGVGVEFTQDDLAIPFIQILQKGSPQIDEDHPDHGQWKKLGAELGQLFNTVTYDLSDELMIVPCGYLACYVEWRARESGGGWIGQHPIDTPLIETCKRNDKNQDVLPNGNTMMLTHYHYCVIVRDDGVTPVVISMTSTQLKKSRRWNTMLATMKMDGVKGPYNPPIFSHLWGITTVAESNDKGSWRGFQLSLIGPIEDVQIYSAAKEFHALISTGVVRVAVPQQESSSSESVIDY